MVGLPWKLISPTSGSTRILVKLIKWIKSWNAFYHQSILWPTARTFPSLKQIHSQIRMVTYIRCTKNNSISRQEISARRPSISPTMVNFTDIQQAAIRRKMFPMIQLEETQSTAWPKCGAINWLEKSCSRSSTTKTLKSKYQNLFWERCCPREWRRGCWHLPNIIWKTVTNYDEIKNWNLLVYH